MAPPHDPHHPTTLLGWLRNRFFAGLFAILPLILTAWIIRFIYRLVSGPASDLLRGLSRDHHSLAPSFLTENSEWLIPLVGFLLTIAVILAIGIIVEHLLGQRLLSFMDWALLRLPVVKGIYQALRQAVQAVQQLGGEKGEATFRQVALIPIPGSEGYTFGFVTGRYVDESGEAMLTIFIPNAPSAFSGFVVAMPEAKVRLTQAFSVEQATKMILSLGLITPGAPAPGAPQPPPPAPR